MRVKEAGRRCRSVAVVPRRSGGADFRWHRCRHTFATRFIERGSSVAALKKLLGHASITTTERYAKVYEDMVVHEARRVWASRDFAGTSLT